MTGSYLSTLRYIEIQLFSLQMDETNSPSNNELTFRKVFLPLNTVTERITCSFDQT